MNWFLVVNDSDCKKELEQFISKQRKSVLMKVETNKAFNNIHRLMNGFTHLTSHGARMTINTASSIHVLKINDVIHCESHRSYTEVHLKNGHKLTVTKTLKQFEAELDDHHFVRIHQSYLVNLNYVVKYVKSNSGHVVLEGGNKLPVAIRKKDFLFKKLEKF